MMPLQSVGRGTWHLGVTAMMCCIVGQTMAQVDVPAGGVRAGVGVHPAGNGPTPRGPLASDGCTEAPTVGEGVFPYDLNNATNDFAGTCGSTTTAEDVWYRYVPTCTGTAVVETCGLTAADSVLLAKDMCSGLVLACNDDTCALQSQISFGVTAGDDYFIRMADFGGGVHTGSIRITCNPAPPNDPCPACLTISGLGLIPFDTTFATTDGTPDPLCLASGTDQIERDLWYCWTPPCPAGGMAILQTCGLTAVDTKIAVYDGVLCPPGPAIACN